MLRIAGEPGGFHLTRTILSRAFGLLHVLLKLGYVSVVQVMGDFLKRVGRFIKAIHRPRLSLLLFAHQEGAVVDPPAGFGGHSPSQGNEVPIQRAGEVDLIPPRLTLEILRRARTTLGCPHTVEAEATAARVRGSSQYLRCGLAGESLLPDGWPVGHSACKHSFDAFLSCHLVDLLSARSVRVGGSAPRDERIDDVGLTTGSRSGRRFGGIEALSGQ